MEFIDNSINTYCKFTEEELFDLFYDENLVHNGNYKISPLTPEFYRFEDVFNYYHKNYSDARKYYKYKNIKIL